MYAIEFESQVKNGIIEIPKKYQKQIHDNVKVIILTEISPSLFTDSPPLSSETDKLQRIENARGKYKTLLSSSSQFAEQKIQEIELER